MGQTLQPCGSDGMEGMQCYIKADHTATVNHVSQTHTLRPSFQKLPQCQPVTRHLPHPTATKA
jgi:hypothetical protein